MISGQVSNEDGTHDVSKLERFLHLSDSGELENTTITSGKAKLEALTDIETAAVRMEYEKVYGVQINMESLPSVIECYNSLQVICPSTKRPINFFCKSNNGEDGSVIHVVVGDSPKFGIITRLFCHTYSEVFKWATVSWYSDAILDEETQIWYTLPDPVFESPLPLQQLSKPHVTACDEGKLWILTCMYPTYKEYISNSHLCRKE